MATTPLTDDQWEEIDTSLLTGYSTISDHTAAAISARYGLPATPGESLQVAIQQRYDHPVVGPSGRRALDALAAWSSAAS